jgi:Caspase recruitment domain
LLEELIGVGVLDDDDVEEIRSNKCVHKQNSKLLQCLENKSVDDLFLDALNKTGQQHVANWIKFGGCEFVCYYVPNIYNLSVYYHG